MSDNTMRIIDLRGKRLTRAEMLEAMPRAEMGTNEASELVRPILDDVKARGAAALRDFGEKFDHIRTKNLRVPAEAMQQALDELDPEVRAAIEESVRRSRAVAASQVPKDFHTDLAEGARVSERWIPIDRVGLYVPGGKAVYPSSVIMNVVPAQTAGVRSLAIATPPSREGDDGLPSKTILATCAILGVTEVYAVGGAQAIAMFAYGARGSEPQDGEILCDPVDKITGPGNIFVATAKSMVSGMVGIDAVAGPTEIAILADKDANPSWVAADLIGQAEHDELAGSVLITDSDELAAAVQKDLDYRVPRTEHAERVATSLTGRQSGIILTDDLDQSVAAANSYAAEHLEIQTADPDAVVPRIMNAGAIFRGPYSPVPLGDYMSGSNHVLPTGGTARFNSGLGVHTFLKPVEVIEYDEQGLKALVSRINAFAVSEDLPGHGECVLSRFVDDPYDKATLQEQERKAGLR
ncbi:histidinol dehydrogenase [Bifidobacterium tibiigranuli]|jgi:histidinol dehydrogenase|uniref:histidinol dehydrogenase n=1 Tax=Bifidobacterium tibiigranuli TaxID=2172043 RepID=UPI00235508F7|nr:histidinol dehydrogenase [Bifidobacterium tibiigranuli]MCH3974865.1 histidinol dehydrogenase [Bifidobacterium tibiigranuli]MCH4190277.1 histidinol dehydrogenase [Bifidobacterium tibiigranuli]MCH4202625.1 histidinol dehydrogenase [Bifidobacterium tibiigranuli]MCH4273643.1 histidinol dehydrogenase [Bifidobacterium tibiigranuli]MCI1210836.1 histidinol dehydrogenase [Bifidobacterium tibiigranuli]